MSSPGRIGVRFQRRNQGVIAGSPPIGRGPKTGTAMPRWSITLQIALWPRPYIRRRPARGAPVRRRIARSPSRMTRWMADTWRCWASTREKPWASPGLRRPPTTLAKRTSIDADTGGLPSTKATEAGWIAGFSVMSPRARRAATRAIRPARAGKLRLAIWMRSSRSRSTAGTTSQQGIVVGSRRCCSWMLFHMGERGSLSSTTRPICTITQGRSGWPRSPRTAATSSCILAV
jgi:hypothetical protein